MADHPNIEVRLETDFFDVADEYKGKVPIVYTGPVDEYFGNSEGRLSWRTVDLEASVEDVDDFQGTGGDQLQRPGRALHPDHRVQALPPRAGEDPPARQDRDRARVLAASPRRATSPTTRSTPPRTARSC